jgi:hypothetical protein
MTTINQSGPTLTSTVIKPSGLLILTVVAAGCIFLLSGWFHGPQPNLPTVTNQTGSELTGRSNALTVVGTIMNEPPISSPACTNTANEPERFSGRRGQLLGEEIEAKELKKQPKDPSNDAACDEIGPIAILTPASSSREYCTVALRRFANAQWKDAHTLFTCALSKLSVEAATCTSWHVQHERLNKQQFEAYLYKCRACCLFELDQPRSCAEMLSEAIARSPRDATSYLLRSEMFREIGLDDRAADDLREAEVLMADSQ